MGNQVNRLASQRQRDQQGERSKAKGDTQVATAMKDKINDDRGSKKDCPGGGGENVREGGENSDPDSTQKVKAFALTFPYAAIPLPVH